MSANSLTAKKVRLAVKHNVSMVELCDQYNISMEECETSIEKFFPGKEAQRVIKNLRRNAKLTARSTPTAEQVEAKAESETEAEAEVKAGVETETEAEAEVKAEVESQAESEAASTESQNDIQLVSAILPIPTGFILSSITEETLATATLADLEHDEKLYSKHAIAIENQDTKLYNEYKAYEKDLDALRKEVRELKAKLEEKRQRVEEIIDAENNLFDQMNELRADHSIVTINLHCIREEKKSRTPVNVLVYDDGNLESEDASLELDTSGYEELYRGFCDDIPTGYENLRLRDLMTLAKVLAIIKNGTKRKVCFIFDNAELEKAYLEQTTNS